MLIGLHTISCVVFKGQVAAHQFLFEHVGQRGAAVNQRAVVYGCFEDGVGKDCDDIFGVNTDRIDRNINILSVFDAVQEVEKSFHIIAFRKSLTI